MDQKEPITIIMPDANNFSIGEYFTIAAAPPHGWRKAFVWIRLLWLKFWFRREPWRWATEPKAFRVTGITDNETLITYEETATFRKEIFDNLASWVRDENVHIQSAGRAKRKPL